ncbi:MAG: SprB repeat-containing protein, partial [Bacteroidota bacterium]
MADAGGNDLLWYDTQNDPSGDPTAPTPSTATAGTFSYFVAQDGGCGNVRSEIEVIVYDVPQITSTPTNPATCGSDDGTITVNATGGTPPLQYAIDGGAFSADNEFDNLASGNYNISVRDANNCQVSTTSVQVGQADGPTLTATGDDASCGEDNGSITYGASGGAAPFRYSLNGGPFETNPNYDNLAAGNYTLTIRDANDCDDQRTITINDTPGVNITSTTPTDETCGQANGRIVINVTGGAGPFAWSTNGGTSYNNGTQIDDLSAGTYNIIVRDANGCTATASETIGGAAGPTAGAPIATETNCDQNTGTITIGASGGAPPYDYSINGGATYITSGVFDNLSADTYTIIVRDANGCTQQATPATVRQADGPTALTPTVTETACGGSSGTLTAGAQDGQAPYSYSINGGVSFETNPLFDDLSA